MTEKGQVLQRVLDKVVDGKKIFGTVFAVKKDGESWFGSSGDLSVNQNYFIASTTKLFTTALIMQLKSEGKLMISDKISNFLEDSILNRLHVYNKTDYSNEITIRHLLAHTSGLPDYFQNKGLTGKSLEKKIISGKDQSWTFDQAIEMAKAMNPKFVPGTKGKANYSDTNFQLLGKIIENITGKSYSDNCLDLIINPLGLKQTYLYQEATDNNPKVLYYQSSKLEIPNAMTSFGPDGGMVSTCADMLVFIEAFFTGKLFPVAYLEKLQEEWNRIFYPLRSGIGIHKFQLPWIFNPTGKIPYFIGHSGLSGALAFYSPKENLYIVGTVNQVANPGLSFKTMIRLTQIMQN